MGAVAKDVEVTSETVHSRPAPVRAERAPVRPERAKRVEARRRRSLAVPLEILELEALDLGADPENDFDDDLTDPDPLSDLMPTWAPAEVGHSLIDEWEASAEARASRPARVAAVLRASAEDTAITSAEKLAVRSAS